jgi:hypothetical protein
LNSDWVITAHDQRSDFTVNANGYQVLVDGGTVDWNNFDIRTASRVMFMNCAGPSTLRNGLVADSGTPELDFYPLHWHLNYDCTRGTLVENVTVRNSPNRAFVPHASHGITFLNSSAFNINKDAFWWNPPCSHPDEAGLRQSKCHLDSSHDIVVDGMLLDTVEVGRGCGMDCQRGSAYMLGKGTGNVIRNSHAENVTGDVNCSAYQWPEKGHGVWVFENNTSAGGNCHGIFVWQNDSTDNIIDGFVGGGVDHGAYGNRFHYFNIDVPYIEVHASGWTVDDSEVGQIVLRKHRNAGQVVFTNVTGSSIVVSDYSTLNGIDFIVNGTNLTCQYVEWTNPHPDTRIIINNQECVNGSG